MGTEEEGATATHTPPHPTPRWVDTTWKKKKREFFLNFWPGALQYGAYRSINVSYFWYSRPHPCELYFSDKLEKITVITKLCLGPNLC